MKNKKKKYNKIEKYSKIIIYNVKGNKNNLIKLIITIIKCFVLYIFFKNYKLFLNIKKKPIKDNKFNNNLNN